jgi:mRNA interferase RelE/StbE
LVWTIEYTDKALAQLRKMDRQTARRILDHLDKRIAYLDDPRTTGKGLTGPLGGLWRYRIGDYRVICRIDDRTIRIVVLTAGHRKNVYD